MDTLGRMGLPRGLVVLLGAAVVVVVAAGLRSVAWLIGPGFHGARTGGRPAGCDMSAGQGRAASRG